MAAQTPPPDATLRDQVAYLVRRFDDHLDEHAQDLKDALKAARSSPRETWMLAATLVMSVASVVSALLLHSH